MDRAAAQDAIQACLDAERRLSTVRRAEAWFLLAGVCRTAKYPQFRPQDGFFASG